MHPTRLFLFSLLILYSCSHNEPGSTIAENEGRIQPGDWRFVLNLGEDELPVNVTISNEGGLKVEFHNADETITAHQCRLVGDSLMVRMPLFDSEFKGLLSSDGETYSGLWYNYGRPDNYSIPFKATHGINYRFCETNSVIPPRHFKDRFEVHFSPENDDGHYAAIGMFDLVPNSNRVTGTFATETGDFRFLDGNFCDGQLKLSCFDGSHAFLFTADYENRNLVNGDFRSGKHWQEPWVGTPSKDFELRDADEITQVIDTSMIWMTKLFLEDGSPKTLNDMGLEGKVVMLQILGTWCPNCVDESNLYKELYTTMHHRGLEVIPISFENTQNISEAYEVLNEFEADLSLPYEVYYGGKKSKSAASEVFPSLSGITSFPTTIFIDRDGGVRKVHTGFYGPGTKLYYDNFVHDTEMLLEEMLAEL